MIDCKSNFSQRYDNNLVCRICKDIITVENEDHLLVCQSLNTENYDVRFSDVYADVDRQYKVTQVYKKVIRRRTV